ncbi:MAG TPA: outer membrane beta-barrel protein [Cyclobacteriaceae bacterium]|nr:outer membrane beta-barrel protein [Cyclobacteriaceae bacterium]
MKIKALLFMMFIGLLYSPIAFAQDEATEEEAPTFTLSGSIDTYFHSSLGSETDAPGTSFANLRGFGLGMANLIGSYSGEKVGFTADLVFGPRGYDAVFTNQYTSQRIVNQLFAYLKLSDAVTLNLGQFNTFVGYEVISPAVNFNYSTSYMFSWGPFNHTGLRADFDFGGGLVGKLAIMNPTDYVEFNDAKSYTIGAQIGKTGDAGGVWLNFLYGDQDGKLENYDRFDDGYSEGSTFQVDLTGGWNLSEIFYLGVNATYRTVDKGEALVGDAIEDVDEDSKGFMGVAVYPKLTLSETFALGLRAEYFKVTNGYIAPFGLDDEGDGSVIDLTLSGNIKTGNLTIIPEFRIDSTSEDSYYKKDFEDVTNMLASFTLAAVYKF